MKITEFKNNYISKNGNPVFVHSFDATTTELKELKDKNAVFLVDKETKENLVFLSEEFPEDTPLKLSTRTNRLYAVSKLLPKNVQTTANTIKALEAAGMSKTEIIQIALGGAQ